MRKIRPWVCVWDCPLHCLDTAAVDLTACTKPIIPPAPAVTIATISSTLQWCLIQSIRITGGCTPVPGTLSPPIRSVNWKNSKKWTFSKFSRSVDGDRDLSDSDESPPTRYRSYSQPPSRRGSMDLTGQQRPALMVRRVGSRQMLVLGDEASIHGTHSHSFIHNGSIVVVSLCHSTMPLSFSS